MYGSFLYPGYFCRGAVPTQRDFSCAKGACGTGGISVCVQIICVSINAFLCIGGCDADCRSRGVHGAVPCRYRAEQAAGFSDGYDVGRTGGNCVPVTGKDTLRLRRGSKPAGGASA